MSLAVDARTARPTVDDGPGISAHNRERVFERFTCGAGAEVPGSGLGLVAQPAAVHGGSAVIEDAPSGGARLAPFSALAGL